MSARKPTANSLRGIPDAYLKAEGTFGSGSASSSDGPAAPEQAGPQARPEGFTQ
ncbi:hypothetical protein BLA15945_01498 [Burkholderia lata]|uniref:Uncharacterized protein n=1 Tax=Burkholderia lata (strain ATCC 17760 / DSM 23089 / LMG 22485 / NCIMB 9086 / R18194 / 383) TaxID=482957 RepID=A0A6P2IW69_BURL3|nr:hypothetical protein BLA15945_01498 [Burkholderia lata]